MRQWDTEISYNIYKEEVCLLRGLVIRVSRSMGPGFEAC